MIKTDRELAITKKKIKEYELAIKEVKDTSDVLARAANIGVESFLLQLKEEVKEYNNIKNGKIPSSFFLFENIGLLLIALRIKNGYTQTSLAEKLGVPQSQISRDENNDYHGVSSTTVEKILQVYGEKLTLKVQKKISVNN